MVPSSVLVPRMTRVRFWKSSVEHYPLMVIDMQEDVLTNAHRREEVTANIAHLVVRARADGMPVIWVQHHDADLRPETPGWQLVPALRPRADEPLIRKTYADAFADTDLEAELERLDVKQLVLCGAQSDCCITATLMGSLYRGYPAALVGEAHTTESSTYQEHTYDAERTIAWVNRQAAFTQLPGVASSLVTVDAPWPAEAVQR